MNKPLSDHFSMAARAANSDDLLLRTGWEVDGQWEIQVCPDCHGLPEHLGSGRWGCGRHMGTREVRDFERVRVTRVASDERQGGPSAE